MIETILQFTGNGFLPSGTKDLDTMKEHLKVNQLVRGKLYRVSKALEPSVKQNNLLHACFDVVADNAPLQRFNTKNKVKFACKVALDYRYQDRIAVAADGTVMFEYRSFGFDDLKDMERLNVFQRGFEFCAEVLGITVEELAAEAKSRMKRHGMPKK